MVMEGRGGRYGVAVDQVFGMAPMLDVYGPKMVR